MATLRLLFRSRPGTALNVGAMCASVQSVFDANNLGVSIQPGGQSDLALPAMTSVSVGNCVAILDSDHLALFEATAQAIASQGEAVVFVVGGITPGGAASGCAAHTAECPGLVITEVAAAACATGAVASAGRWVLAHEIGHLLGLQHDGTSSSLMWDPPTAITAPMPMLSESEKATALAAALIAPAVSFALPADTSVQKKRKKQQQKKKKKTTKKRAKRRGRPKTKKARTTLNNNYNTSAPAKKAAVKKKRRSAQPRRGVATPGRHK